MNVTELPSEMILEIFEKLNPRELKMAVLVCKKWRSIGENPRLWSWCILSLSSLTDSAKLEVRRTSNVEKICVEKCHSQELNNMLKTLVKLPKLRILLGLAYRNLSLVEPRLLARIINKVEEAEWCFNTRIRPEQAQLVLQYMSKKTNLKSLQMINNYVSNVQPEILGLAVNNLEKLWIANAPNGPTFTPEQINAVFETMEEKTKLKELIIRDINIAHVEPTTLASALNKVEEVMIWTTFSHADITVLQVQSLFNTLCEQTQLKRLLLLTWNMISVQPGIFGKALNNLEEITLVHGMITNDQAQAFFSNMSKKTFLKRLTIINNNLSMIEPNILAKGVRQLQEVTLVRCDLTTGQALTVCSAINEGSSLTSMDISYNKLTSVDEEVLAKAVNKLQNVSIDNNQLTPEQITTILRLCQNEETKLKKMILRNTKLADIEPRLLSIALNKLEEVGLDGCSLSTEQLNMILKKATAENSKLQDIDLRNQDLSVVDSEIMEEVAYRFSVSCNF